MKKKKTIKEVVTKFEGTPIPANEHLQTLVIRIDGGLGRNIAMAGAITEVAKHIPVKVIASWPLVFWGNPYIQSVHGLDDRRLYREVIMGNDYIEIEPYTDPEFFNNGRNWLEIVEKQLSNHTGIKFDKTPQPCLFLAEHEKLNNKLDGANPILFQPFGSTTQQNGSDKSYRSMRPEDAQYLANGLIAKGYTVYVVERPDQPKLEGCVCLDTPDMRWVMSLCARYPVVGCDSCLHHASKAFGMQALVLWSATDAERYGYDSNINVREHEMVMHTPLRLGLNDFNDDVINQYTNIYSKDFLDYILKTYL